MAPRSAVRSRLAALTQPPRLAAGAELSSSWPPGSVVIRPLAGRAPGASRPSSAAATRVAGTCSARSRRSQTSHSSSTPTWPGGPVLKQIPCTCASASCSVRGGAIAVGLPMGMLRSRPCASTLPHTCDLSGTATLLPVPTKKHTNRKVGQNGKPPVKQPGPILRSRGERTPVPSPPVVVESRFHSHRPGRPSACPLPRVERTRIHACPGPRPGCATGKSGGERKSTRLNSSHDQISYAVFCLKKKKKKNKLLFLIKKKKKKKKIIIKIINK